MSEPLHAREAGAVEEHTVDRLRVRTFPEGNSAGTAAAQAVARSLRHAVDDWGGARVAFAAAPSQEGMLSALARQPDVPWERVTAFHLDEYVGLPAGHGARFGEFLRRRIFDPLPLGAVHLLDPGDDPAAECARYAALLAEAPLDVVCLGIGENGHLAFNDPPVADFEDSQAVKVVELDEASRRQQVSDGCFAALDEVPRAAVSLTLPTVLGARSLHCVVPGARKRSAVTATLYGPVTTACPASGLRRHPDATLYLDAASAPSSTEEVSRA